MSCCRDSMIKGYQQRYGWHESWLCSTKTMPLGDDPLWFKDAIIYEAHVKSFFDSNDDGIGDFNGLTSKLDYLQDLGITCLWLLPFFPSPLKDDGYDISDYRNVHPSYGTLADFKALRRGRAPREASSVLIELVVNHTSDQHPWFQAARRAPRGSRERELLRLERHRQGISRDADHLHRHRTLELDVRPGGGPVLLASLLLASARSQSQQPRGRGRRHRDHDVLARDGRRCAAARCRAVPVRARGHEQREPARDARGPEADPRARSTSASRTRCCSARRISGRPTCVRTSATATNATWRSTSR